MITASLVLAGHTITVTWEAGAIAGDQGAVAYIQALAQRLEGAEVGSPSLPKTTTNHLASPQSFMALCELASDRYPTFSGDLPDQPDLSGTIPEGVDL